MSSEFSELQLTTADSLSRDKATRGQKEVTKSGDDVDVYDLRNDLGVAQEALGAVYGVLAAIRGSNAASQDHHIRGLAIAGMVTCENQDKLLIKHRS